MAPQETLEFQSAVDVVRVHAADDTMANVEEHILVGDGGETLGLDSLTSILKNMRS